VRSCVIARNCEARMTDLARFSCKRCSRHFSAKGRLLAAALSIIVMMFFISRKPTFDDHEIAALPGLEEIGIYTFYGNEPTFLADVFPAEYSANGSQNIHQAHVNGLPHIGAWIHILDRFGRANQRPSHLPAATIVFARFLQ
jgi:hypothetical protein